MVVATQSGLMTSLSCWAHMRVEGDSVVLASSSDESWPASTLVVVAFPSEEEAKAMFDRISQRIQFKARTFDARDWPGMIRSHAPKTRWRVADENLGR